MDMLRPIADSLAGEHVLAAVPPLRAYVQASGDEALRKRLNYFPQRALTHIALTEEQRSRGADVLRLGLSVAPGIVDGLEVDLDGDTLIVMPGHAIAADGEDVRLTYPLRIAFDAPTVVSARVDELLAARAGGPEKWNALSPLQRRASLREVLKALGEDPLSHAMALVALPRSVVVDRSDGADCACANIAGSLGLARPAWEDGFELAWVPWPTDRSLPPWTSDGKSVDPRFRNRLAYAIFNAERERLSPESSRSIRRWLDRQQPGRSVVGASASWPWDGLGVALSIVGFDANFKPAFADRAAVVRQGGGRHNRSALVAGAGDDVLWQARVSQLLEHLAELPPEQRNADVLSRQFDWLPPAGILPIDVAAFAAGRQTIFPATFDVQARPVPLDMVDALIAESAPLVPYNLSLRDQVQILVPVASRYFDPDLLELNPRIHPLFDLEVARLENERQALLARRDGLQRRFDALMRSVSGDIPAWPEDDPNALPDETGALDALAFARIHRSTAAAAGTEAHGFETAAARFALAAGDALFVFARVDAAPASLRLVVKESAVPGQAAPAARVFCWGVAVNGATRIGDLPPVGVWSRLTVSVAGCGLAGKIVDGLSFGIHAGNQEARVAWGYTGKTANGREQYWVADTLPTGASIASDAKDAWKWEVQGEAFDAGPDAAFGLPIEGGVGSHPHTRHVTELDNLLARCPKVLAVELGEPEGGVRTASTPPRTADAGLSELITRLDARIRMCGDHTDFGFLRARVDIFRVRQSVLGVEEAGRFLTSPAAAELVQRNANPVATEKEFADYFNRLGKTPAPSPFDAAPTTDTTVSPKTVAAKATTTGFRVTASEKMTTVRSLFDVSGSRTSSPPPAEGAVPAAAEIKPALLASDIPPAIQDVVGASLLGATFNTVTVADRFQSPAAIVTSNATAKGKNDFVVNGATALAGAGVVLNDIPIYGYSDGTKKDLTVGELLAPGSKVADVDGSDVTEEDAHESVYFQRGIDAVDNMVRFLRGIELRAEEYRRLQADASATRERILGVASSIQAAIGALAGHLAEVRHDLSVTRALRAEELDRLARLAARRKAILAEQVPYLVFRRPRFTAVMQDVPLLAVQPAETQAAGTVPVWSGETHAAPPELLEMVDTLRDVPVRWFVRLIRELPNVDRIGDVQRVVDEAARRIGAGSTRAVKLGFGRESMTGGMIQSALDRHAARVEKSRVESATALSKLDASSWKQAIDPLQGIASVRDLLQVLTVSRTLTLAAAGLMDEVASVAGGLYAAFCTVPPASRLRWAELFSQFDEGTSLRQLTVLPGFGDERLGVDFIAWRQMQAMVDWLFTEVSADADAQGAINDLVRVCLLLSAHAPVKRILSARIKRPVPAVPNGLLDIELDPATTRIGTQVLVHATVGSAEAVVARAVVEDVVATGASARITQVMTQAAVMLDETSRVQVQTGPALSTPAVQRAEEARAKAAAVPPGAAKAGAAKRTEPEPAAEKGVAKRVEALRQSSARGMRM